MGATFAGVAAIREFLEEWRGRYEDYQAELVEALDLGSGVGFAVSRENVRLVGSMVDARLQEVWTYTFACVDGVVTRVTASSKIDEARAAAEHVARELADG